MLVTCAFGAYATLLKKDVNFDFLNYHWYNGYAFLNNRYDVDSINVQLRRFVNPLLDVPVYLLAQNVGAKVVAFCLGAVQGLNLVLVFYLARLALQETIGAPVLWLCAMVAIAGGLGANNLSELGTVFMDNIVSLGALAALLTICAGCRSKTPGTVRSLGFASAGGIILGLFIGLKLTLAIYAVGICVAFLIAGGRQRLWLGIAFSLATVLGFLASDGAWLLKNYMDTGNPILPLYNNVFRSPLLEPLSFTDTRFVPKSTLEALYYPFVIAVDPHRVSEVLFRDFRIPLFYATSIIAGAVLANRMARKSVRPNLSDFQTPTFLLVAATVSLLVWSVVAGIYRYLAALEVLAPTLIATAVFLIVPNRRVAVWGSAAIAIFVMVTTVPGSWGRKEWSKRWVEIDIPKNFLESRAMVVIVGTPPSSFVIPSFPKSYVFVQVGDTFTLNQAVYFKQHEGQGTLYDKLRQRIASYNGPLFVMWIARAGLPDALLYEFKLARRQQECGRLESNLYPYVEICRAERIAN